MFRRALVVALWINMPPSHYRQDQHLISALASQDYIDPAILRIAEMHRRSKSRRSKALGERIASDSHVVYRTSAHPTKHLHYNVPFFEGGQDRQSTGRFVSGCGVGRAYTV